MYVDFIGFVTVYVCSNIRQISSNSYYKCEIAHPSRVSEHTNSEFFHMRSLFLYDKTQGFEHVRQRKALIGQNRAQ